MKRYRNWSWRSWVLVLAILSLVHPTFSQNRQQTIALRPGWNAVHLAVEPLDTSPDAVFGGTPVDIVARYFPRLSPVQYISDPADAPWNEPGWGVWYAPERPESIVSSLHAIHGNKPYLVHATSAHTWTVTGRVSVEGLSWQADSFNLVGFCVDDQSPPTFERHLAGAGGRIGGRIYRLDAEGRWQPVTWPATTTVRSGEAYWIYCRGRTDYQGPLEVKVPGVGELDFGCFGTELDIEMFNNSADPAVVTVEVTDNGGDLPLVQVVPDMPRLRSSYVELQPVTQLPPIPSGQSGRLQLRVRRESMTAVRQTRLLKLTSSQGVRCWIPVLAQRADGVGQP